MSETPGKPIGEIIPPQQIAQLKKLVDRQVRRREARARLDEFRKQLAAKASQPVDEETLAEILKEVQDAAANPKRRLVNPKK